MYLGALLATSWHSGGPVGYRRGDATQDSVREYRGLKGWDWRRQELGWTEDSMGVEASEWRGRTPLR